MMEWKPYGSFDYRLGGEIQDIPTPPDLSETPRVPPSPPRGLDPKIGRGMHIMETTDKQLMSWEDVLPRDLIETWRELGLSNNSTMTPCVVNGLCDTALAAHDIYDKAIEDAAQAVEAHFSVGPNSFWLPEEAGKVVRKLKGTSNG